jgi:hypothetical protein
MSIRAVEKSGPRHPISRGDGEGVRWIRLARLEIGKGNSGGWGPSWASGHRSDGGGGEEGGGRPDSSGGSASVANMRRQPLGRGAS